ncbi:unnamed protein product [Cyprideis torosa]|uniref:Uncharacterized protein n=1 Tax=Cyprideis torosa TaxID=163714 RepID=A0A7R8W3L8_9CRUS|nr:unnamed protein product [Cyprideis torosa]CAG0883147.1 unnamed protein product [Cyprideis torosa]
MGEDNNISVVEKGVDFHEETTCPANNTVPNMSTMKKMPGLGVSTLRKKRVRRSGNVRKWKCPYSSDEETRRAFDLNSSDEETTAKERTSSMTTNGFSRSTNERNSAENAYSNESAYGKVKEEVEIPECSKPKRERSGSLLSPDRHIAKKPKESLENGFTDIGEASSSSGIDCSSLPENGDVEAEASMFAHTMERRSTGALTHVGSVNPFLQYDSHMDAPFRSFHSWEPAGPSARAVSGQAAVSRASQNRSLLRKKGTRSQSASGKLGPATIAGMSKTTGETPLNHGQEYPKILEALVPSLFTNVAPTLNFGSPVVQNNGVACTPLEGKKQCVHESGGASMSSADETTSDSIADVLTNGSSNVATAIVTPDLPDDNASYEMVFSSPASQPTNFSVAASTDLEGGSAGEAPVSTETSTSAVKHRKRRKSYKDLPAFLKKHLKWKWTSITPVVVRRTVLHSNIRIIKDTEGKEMWIGTWGKHMKSVEFQALSDYLKLNHFPGTFIIGRKDRLWKGFCLARNKFGKKEFNYLPRTFILPDDAKELKEAMESQGNRARWICKPPASARGVGITVVQRYDQVKIRRTQVVQKYIARPFLINETKFDLRLYVLITSFDPMRVYIYDDGLVRFASNKYSPSSKSLADQFIHLTNYSINRKASNYQNNETVSDCFGHKWCLSALWKLFHEKGIDTNKLWGNILDIVVKTMITAEASCRELTYKYTSSRNCCYELFGFDIMLDETLKPWLLEVNISPSLHSGSTLDQFVKGPLVQNILNMAMYRIPPSLSAESKLRLQDLVEETAPEIRSNVLTFDSRLYTYELSRAERAKHAFYVNHPNREEYLETILKHLTPDDVRILVVTEDEFARRGRFIRVFPTTSTHSYFRFLDEPRYYNMLLDAWEHRYASNRRKGIQLLEMYCSQDYHLHVGENAPTVHVRRTQRRMGSRMEKSKSLTQQSVQTGHSRRALNADGEVDPRAMPGGRSVGGLRRGSRPGVRKRAGAEQRIHADGDDQPVFRFSAKCEQNGFVWDEEVVEEEEMCTCTNGGRTDGESDGGEAPTSFPSTGIPPCPFDNWREKFGESSASPTETPK